MLLGKYQLSLTSDFLAYYDREMDRIVNFEYQETFLTSDERLMTARRFFRRLKNLSITSTSINRRTPINLSYFPSLNSLELENINIDDIQNLYSFRSQIKSLTLRKCVLSNHSLDALFREDTPWPLLRNLTITSAKLEIFNSSWLPNSLKNLNLSWNFISSFEIGNLSHLSSLDLSFNRLTAIPRFERNDLLSNSLKVLRLRSNLISNLKGLENLSVLTELDLSQNFIIDSNELVSTLSNCSRLETLSINDNPVTHSSNLLSLLNKSMPQLKSVDGLKLSSASSSSSLFSSNASFIPIYPTIQSSVATPVLKPSVSEIEADNYKNSRSAKTIIKNGSDGSSEQQRAESKGRKIKPKSRIASILDKGENESRNHDSQSQTLNIEEKVLEAGKESPQSIFAYDQCDMPYQDFFSNLPLAHSTADDINFDLCLNESPDEKGKVSEKSTDDDIEVIKDESKLDLNWTDDDTANIESMFLVETKEKKSVFLFIKDDIIYEKDCFTGDVRTSHDLNILSNAEFFDDISLTLKLFFDSRVKNKKEVIYTFEDEQSFNNFKKKYISPSIVKRNFQLSLKSEPAFRLMQCLKCNFKQVSENDQSKVCPQCGSQYTFISNQQ